MIINNPYKFLGPLDPQQDRLVLIPRNEEMVKIIQGLHNGDYWSISGPRQVGKTTFLRQIQDVFSDAYYIYFDLENPPKKDDVFYRWLKGLIIEEIPSNRDKNLKDDWDNESPEFSFLGFLSKFRPVNDAQKVVLLFDEIDGIPFIKTFLHIWRKVFHERYQKKELQRYAVAITGSADLIAHSTGPKSPFNIAKKLYLGDFTNKESEGLIAKPFKELNIDIELEAKEEIISQISGHPQILQHTCSSLVDIAIKERRSITIKDVNAAIDNLFKNNTSIYKLKSDIRKNKELEKLLRDIINGNNMNFFRYQDYSTKGAGAIFRDVRGFCAIRNEVYKKFLIDFLNMVEDDRYEKIKEIGAGANGVVYKARDNVLDRIVAVKQLSSKLTKDKGKLNRILTEARITAKLAHANIVRLYDIQLFKGSYYIIMEYIDGESYRVILNKKKALELYEILDVGEKLFAALDYSHRKGVIHRDIKPQHILKDRDSGIKIIDFGIAIPAESHDENNDDKGYIVGSPFYMSPEQISYGQVDHRSDIYSAGVTLFKLITGEVPFKGSNKEAYQHHLYMPVPSIMSLRPDMPYELDELIKKCMQKRREDRYQSAREALEEIKTINKK